MNYPSEIEDQEDDKVHEIIAKHHQERQTWAYYDRMRKEAEE